MMNVGDNHHHDENYGASTLRIQQQQQQQDSSMMSLAPQSDRDMDVNMGISRPVLSPPTAPVLIEEETEVFVRPPQQQQQQQQLFRPVALKVVRPAQPPRPPVVSTVATVPSHAAASFYEQAHEHGLEHEELQKALYVSAEWHRKWSNCQEETNHGYKQSAAFDYIPDDFEYERCLGAKNPSPEERGYSSCLEDELEHETHKNKVEYDAAAFDQQQQDMEPRKRVRSSLREQEDEPAENENEQEALDVGGGYLHHTNKRYQPTMTSTSSGLVRPIALRIVPRPSSMMRPAVVVEEEEEQAEHEERELLHRLPWNIHDNNNNNNNRSPTFKSQASMSPLTVSSSSKSPSSFMLEDDQEDENDRDSNRGGHLIEPDENEEEEYGLVEEEDDNYLLDSCRSIKGGVPLHIRRPTPVNSLSAAVQSARDGLLLALAGQGGITLGNVKFQECLDRLLLQQQQGGSSMTISSEEATWVSLTAPLYFGSLGNNDAGDPLYTLGRMAFDMFSPTSLICSLQGTFNSVQLVSDEQRMALLQTEEQDSTAAVATPSKHASVPKTLREEVLANTSALRTYNIIAAFTIEPPLPAYPDAPNGDVHRPIKGIMTTYGYTLPDPSTPNRYSLWITGGRIEPNPGSDGDLQAWKKQFQLHPAQHSLSELAKLLAVKWLMGAQLHPMNEQTGRMEYSFTRPIGGHGVAYVDTLYCDSSLRIVRGHRGTVFVFSKLYEQQVQDNNNNKE